MKTSITKDSFFKLFLYSTAALLLVTAAAKLYSATGTHRILGTSDPLLQVNYRAIMSGVGLLESAIAFYLLMGRSLMAKSFLVFWLSSNFMVYRFATDFLGIKMCPCLGTLTAKLPLSESQVGFLLMLTVLYFFFGSTYILLTAWSNQEVELQGISRLPSSGSTVPPVA
jgi:hypothetical protein